MISKRDKEGESVFNSVLLLMGRGEGGRERMQYVARCHTHYHSATKAKRKGRKKNKIKKKSTRENTSHHTEGRRKNSGQTVRNYQ